MSYFDENGLFDSDRFEQDGKPELGVTFKYATDVILAAVREHEPAVKAAGFNWNNLRAVYDFEKATYTIFARPVEQQDPELVYELPEEGVTYTYTPADISAELATFDLPESKRVQVYAKDFKDFVHGYIEGRFAYVRGSQDHTYERLASIGTDIMDDQHRDGAFEVGETYEFRFVVANDFEAVPAARGNMDISAVALTQQRDFALTVEILENPTATTVNPGLNGGTLNIQAGAIVNS